MDQQPSENLPLSGIRVIDLATVVAGPYAAGILGEFGAEVLKVEHPVGGDTGRHFGTPGPRGDTLVWVSEGRNKKSVTIDLHRAEGVQMFKDLIAKSDVLVEDFRPGTMEKWGIGWDVLHAINPGLIMLRVSGYGQTGPYKDRPGFRPRRPRGRRAHLSRWDAEGHAGDRRIDHARRLLHRTVRLHRRAARAALQGEDGRGQYIDAALYESVFRCTDELAPAYAMYGTVHERHGPHMESGCPYGHFPTRDGKWVAIACTTDKMFGRLAEAMGRPELASSSLYGEQKARIASRTDVNEIVRDWCGSMPREEVLARCNATGAPAAPLNNIADIFGDRQFHARRNLVSIDDARSRRDGDRAERHAATLEDSWPHQASRAAARPAHRRGAEGSARNLRRGDRSAARTARDLKLPERP